jgi:hypothetical protein
MKLLGSVCLLTLCLLILWNGLTAAGPGSRVEGVLIDKACSYKVETRIVGDHLEGGMLSAYVHPRNCLVMPDCKKSGYGVYTYDQKYLTFDNAGNQKASELIQTSKKEDDFRVEVTGEVQGDTIKVTSVRLLPE